MVNPVKCVSDTGFVCEPLSSTVCENALGNCAAGTQTCAADGSGFEPCSITPQNADSCVDGDDANCNGIPNEGCACVDGESQACGPAEVGICRRGTSACDDGIWSPVSEGQVLPEERDCGSQADNNCDGFPDNTLDSQCKCAPGATRSRDPYQTGGAGICTLGSQTCDYVFGHSRTDWGTCVGAVPPEAQEMCDAENADEDCDGMNNEACECVDGETSACGADVGECAFGTQTCRSGAWDACVGGTSEKRGRDLCRRPGQLRIRCGFRYE